jgi:surface antigen
LPGPVFWPILRPVWRRSAVIAAMLPWVAACSVPAQLSSFFSRDPPNDTTSSISQIAPVSMFTGSDVAAASGATAALFEREVGEESAPWDNPLTGARGTITPLATAYRDNGIECRDFLASFVRDRTEAWMQGEACRNGFGRWEVRSIKPWRR